MFSLRSFFAFSKQRPLQNLQPMEHQRLARHLSNQQNRVEYPFGDEPSPLHFKFQAAK
ncbi:MAG: hypothetical protein ACFNNL_07590 [Kingella oralis]